MQTMTCKNCCAPINPHLDHCEYCGGYFERKTMFLPLDEPTEIRFDAEKLITNNTTLMTPNELRRAMGMTMFDHCRQQYIVRRINE